jgi:UDP-N-acetylglucosamine--N-acetylmuramyl-(pentapeptide) pyrophosphoryl-undecaprenol N-acetylglucosamine transferase
MKLLITGGHITPALAIIDEVAADKKSDVEIVFVGRKHTSHSKREISLEYQEIHSRNIRFIDLEAGRMTRVLSFNILKNISKLPKSYLHAFSIIRKEKPDMILTFGSYIGLPIAICGWLLGVPVYVHEQTIHPGLSNQLIGQFATQIFVSFPESREYFNKKKTLVTGNPVRKQIFETLKKPFTINKTHPVIYITGGSLGSHSINALIKPILTSLLKRYIVIHQTGNVAQYKDYDTFKQLKHSLPVELRHRYFLKSHFLSDEIGYIYSQADLVIGRSGANTFFELVALHKPAIFIPLPWSANREQQKHAEMFRAAGTGEVFEQEGDSEKFLGMIVNIVDNIDSYKENFKNLDSLYKHNAVQLILKNNIDK